MSNGVTAVILAGGKGTRLRSVVSDVPKCLAEVNNRPFIFYILDQLAEIKVERIVLAVNYLGNKVRDYVGYSHKGIPVFYSYDTIEDGGTGHAARMAAEHIVTSEVLVMNGDTYIDISFYDFINETRTGYGNTGFVLNINNDIMNMGVYLTDNNLITNYIPKDKTYYLEKSFLKDVHKHGFIPYIINSPYIDIGTPESYAKADKFMQSIL